MRAIAKKRRDGISTNGDVEGLSAWIHADIEFHLALMRAAGNARLVRAVKDLRVLTQVFRAQRHLRPVEDLERSCEQHQRLIEALARRDADAARKCLGEHIRFGCENAIDDQAEHAAPVHEMPAPTHRVQALA
jgi:DNA-binding GntR family transcriptional regulator